MTIAIAMMILAVTMLTATATMFDTGNSINRRVLHETGDHEHAPKPSTLRETKLDNVVLPKPLSDFTTVYDAMTSTIYISGGCDSLNGNEYIVDDGGFFICTSISDSHYEYDIASMSFRTLSNMPQSRYRHISVLLPETQQIVLYGGRDVIGSILTTIDVYNITDNTWTTYNSSSSNSTIMSKEAIEKYYVSDATGFYHNGTGSPRIYVFGGYNVNYTAQANSFYLEVSTTNNEVNVVFKDIAPLPTARGDTSSVTFTNATSGDMYAMVTGGFTDTNEFCFALNTTDIYDIKTDTWIEWIDNNELIIGRGDKVLVRTTHNSANQPIVGDQYIYAIGGERPIENICTVTKVDVGTETVPINDIEYYNVHDHEWMILNKTSTTISSNSNITVLDERFRFAAVVDERTNKIYTFGGQVQFNSTCQCFPTTADVYVYTEILIDDDDDENDQPSNDNSTSNAVLSNSKNIIFGWMAVILVLPIIM